jgi:hypothetical protein
LTEKSKREMMREITTDAFSADFLDDDYPTATSIEVPPSLGLYQRSVQRLARCLSSNSGRCQPLRPNCTVTHYYNGCGVIADVDGEAMSGGGQTRPCDTHALERACRDRLIGKLSPATSANLGSYVHMGRLDLLVTLWTR